MTKENSSASVSYVSKMKSGNGKSRTRRSGYSLQGLFSAFLLLFFSAGLLATAPVPTRPSNPEVRVRDSRLRAEATNAQQQEVPPLTEEETSEEDFLEELELSEAAPLETSVEDQDARLSWRLPPPQVLPLEEPVLVSEGSPRGPPATA